MTSLDAIFGPELMTAIERLVDKRVDQALERRHGRDDSSPWLTITEAADYLRTSERTVQRLLQRDRLRTSTIGRRRLVHRDELDNYMRATGEDVAPTTSPRRRA